MPTRCNRGFYCISYCLLNMFRAPLCPSPGAQMYYTVVAACGISCCGFQVAGLLWSWGLCVLKPDQPIRPIVNWRNAPAYRLSRPFTDNINHLLPPPNAFNVKNTQDILLKPWWHINSSPLRSCIIGHYKFVLQHTGERDQDNSSQHHDMKSNRPTNKAEITEMVRCHHKAKLLCPQRAKSHSTWWTRNGGPILRTNRRNFPSAQRIFTPNMPDTQTQDFKLLQICRWYLTNIQLQPYRDTEDSRRLQFPTP